VTHHDVLQQMREAGLDDPPLPLRLDGRPVRFGPKKNHWYALREERTAAGGLVVLGAFGDWRGDQRHRVRVDWRAMSEAEREAMLQQRRAVEEAERARRAQLAAMAQMQAAELWARAAREGCSEYLRRKGVQGEACRYLPDGSIVVPLLRYDQPRDSALKALQRIWPDGSKRFTKGFSKPGTCLRIGHLVVGEPLLVCEGYATGLTLRMAVQRRLPVVVALDAGNLEPVVALLRALHPDTRLLVCADDDWQTAGNPGRDKGLKAARAVDGCDVVYPIFAQGQRALKDTDFNDLHMRQGLGAVWRQVRTALQAVGAGTAGGVLDAAAG